MARDTAALTPTPNPVDVHVGARIRYLRKTRGLSQEALSERLGLTFQQIQKYERGSNRVSASKMLAACEVLGCRPNDLFDGLPLPGAGEETADRAAARHALNDPQAIALLSAFSRAGPDDRMVLLALAKRLAGART